jgi:hypothetical protein
MKKGEITIETSLANSIIAADFWSLLGRDRRPPAFTGVGLHNLPSPATPIATSSSVIFKSRIEPKHVSSPWGAAKTLPRATRPGRNRQLVLAVIVNSYATPTATALGRFAFDNGERDRYTLLWNSLPGDATCEDFNGLSPHLIARNVNGREARKELGR